MMFTEWFNQKFIEWRGNRIGQDASQSAFARWLGIKQQVIDGYLKGNNIPSHKRIIDKLVEKFGPDVYRVLGLNIQAEEELVIEIQNLPPELYPELIKRIQELRAEYIGRQAPRKGSAGRRSSEKSAPEK